MENIEGFDYKETNRRDGFTIMCPGNLDSGWPDGEKHDDYASVPNDSTIVYEDNGWPKFSCRHNHCGEGAEHGKKTWLDLQNFYDPDRKFHLFDQGDFEPDVRLDVDMDDVEALAEVADDEATKPEEVAAFLNDDQTQIVELIVETIAHPPGPVKLSLEMPDSCMRGKLGERARQLAVPLGFAYPAMIGCYSAVPTVDQMDDTRINVFVALCGKPGQGKNVTIRRAIQVMQLLDYKRLDIGGDMQLTRSLGDHTKTSGRGVTKTTTITPGPRKLLMINSEISDVLAKTMIEGSTLAGKLCDLWDENEYDKPDGKDIIHVNCRLSWIGGLPADENDTSRFVELFGVHTNLGLYQRFIFGYSAKEWRYNHWAVPVNRREIDLDMPPEQVMAEYNAGCTPVNNISPEAQAAYDSWYPQLDIYEGWDIGRLRFNLLKVALLTASASGLTEVNLDYMTGAIEFMDWQVRFRKVFITSMAQIGNKEASFADTKLIPALEEAGAYDKYVNWRRISLDRKWDRKVDVSTQLRTIEGLIALGRLKPELKTDDDGNELQLTSKNLKDHRFYRVMLRRSK
jgi:hypothetical protein